VKFLTFPYTKIKGGGEMLESIEALYNDGILHEVLSRYGITGSEVEFIGGFDSYVYTYKKGNEKYILKITHSLRRSKEEMIDEANFLLYLKNNGAAVAAAIPSLNGNLVEVIPIQDEGYFLSMAYEEAAGKTPASEDWNSEFFYEWGRATGELHCLSSNYSPKNWSRKHWLEEEYLNVEKYIPADQKTVIEKSKLLIERLKQLPRENEFYGIVHGDLHYLNFFLDDGKIQLYDFDDIHYNHFVNDIAVVVFYAYWRPLSKETDFETFLNHFLQGYLSRHVLSKETFLLLPEFLKVRHLILYIAALQELTHASLNAEEKDFLMGLRKVIEEDLPIVNFDFDHFWDKHVEHRKEVMP
jgi:amicoumacin kinase